MEAKDKLEQDEAIYQAGYVKAKCEFNPNYLDFQKGIDAGKVLGKQAGQQEVLVKIKGIYDDASDLGELENRIKEYLDENLPPQGIKPKPSNVVGAGLDG